MIIFLHSCSEMELVNYLEELRFFQLVMRFFNHLKVFIIQLYYEIGIIGLFIFLLLMTKIFRNLKNKEVFFIILILSIFTPSLYGYGSAFFFYYFFIFKLFI